MKPNGEPVIRLVHWAIFQKIPFIAERELRCALVALAAARNELRKADQDDEARPREAYYVRIKIPERSQKEAQAEEHYEHRHDLMVSAAA
jgi:hypothetical protein